MTAAQACVRRKYTDSKHPETFARDEETSIHVFGFVERHWSCVAHRRRAYESFVHVAERAIHVRLDPRIGFASSVWISALIAPGQPRCPRGGHSRAS